MKSTPRNLLFVTSLLSPFSVSASTDHCGALLKDGIFDQTVIVNSEKNESYFHSEVCETYNSNKKSNSNNGLSLDGVSFSLSGDQVSSYGRHYCEQNTNFNLSTIDNYHFKSMVSSTVVNAYQNCISMANSSITYTINESQKDTNIQLDLNIGLNAGSRVPKFNGLIVYPSDAAECQWVSGSSPVIGEEMPYGIYSLQCTQTDISRDVNISLALDSHQTITHEFKEKSPLSTNEFDQINARINSLIQTRSWYSHSVVSNVDYFNSYGKEIEVVVSGGGGAVSGAGGNACRLDLYVDQKLVQYHNNVNRDWSKTCVVTATVPKGSTWRVKSNPHWGGTGKFTVNVLR